MELSARYQDGLVAEVHEVACRIEGDALVIRDAESLFVRDRWPADQVYPLHGRPIQLRIANGARPLGARLVFSGPADIAAARAMLPALKRKSAAYKARQWKLVGLSTMALASVVAAYVYGVPLLASRIVGVIPVQWEADLGTTVARQIEEALVADAGWEICDPDPDSIANRAITRFSTAALEGAGSPFVPDVQVIRTDVPNAFALPGGRAYYFSALLEQTESPDEFAGVLAHELGHVAHRHAMEQLIATSATGLLIGFILGDMTGLSIAGGIGASLIDSRFSREAEREADRFAADVARRMAFQPVGLANLLERVSGDDDYAEAFALLSTHPLTSERRAALEALEASPAASPAFTDEEWQAIRTMCDAGTTIKTAADTLAKGETVGFSTQAEEDPEEDPLDSPVP